MREGFRVVGAPHRDARAKRNEPQKPDAFWGSLFSLICSSVRRAAASER